MNIAWFFGARTVRLALASSSVAVICGCAGPEATFRDAHDVVTDVIDLTVDVKNPSDAADLYALEERVETACRPFFQSASRQWTFGDIPFYNQVQTLMTSGRCRESVDEARRLLDGYQQPGNLSPPHENREPLILSN